MKKSKVIEHFWITNISNRIVSLGDLAVSIQPYSSVNLLDSRHYYLTKAQLFHSATKGSIFKYSNRIIIRQLPPIEQRNKDPLVIEHNPVFPSKRKSAIETENVIYDELLMSDEEYANESAEFAENDRLNKYNK